MKETLGEMILKNYEKNETPEAPQVREFSTEVYKKQIKSLIEKTIQEGSKEYRGKKFYITLYGYNELQVDQNLAHFKVVGRKSRPSPEWKQTVFSYDPSLSSSKAFRYEWMLPKKESAMQMIVNPDGWHPHLIENIQKFLNGKLS